MINSQEQELSRRSLRRLRVENKMSLAAVGELLGVHKSHVLRMEKGTRATPTLRQMSDAFNVRPWEVTASCHVCAYLPPEGYTCQNCGCAEPLSLTENVKTVSVTYLTEATNLNQAERTQNLRIPVGLDEWSEAGAVERLIARHVRERMDVEVTGYKYTQ